MIVITHLSNEPRYVCAGDTFNLTIKDITGCKVIICEEITIAKTIDFIASFRFALEDGTVPGFHLMGIFGCRAELPREFDNAKTLDDLTPEQKKNFIETCGIKI